MKFFNGLVAAAEKFGAKFYEDTEALEILGTGPIKVVTTEGNTLTAEQVIVTTYEPFNNPKPIHFKKGMYISYVYEYRVKGGKVLPGLYIDLANPYHYTRVDRLPKGWSRIIVGGEDHREDIKVNPIRHFRALEQYMEETFSSPDLRVVRRWKGKILEPSDGLPLIGEVSMGQYIATAFSGNGMTYAPMSAMIIRDLIIGKKNSYEKIYSADRKLKLKAVLHKARDYTGELLGGAAKNLFK
jgi:glycine/D-amino acid oxidase-like deaminating enzyme